MSHIYREKREIPIPKGAHASRTDGRVFVFVATDPNVPIRDRKRMNIGKQATATTMYPNENFRYFFPQLWEQHYGGADNKMPYILHPGMYALTLGICYQNSLYPLLLDVFGPAPANQIIDYSMYSIMQQSNVSLGYKDRMASEVLFSHGGACSDSALSAFFSQKISDEQSYDFRSKWLDSCVSRGVTKAWISIDGSNSDCTSHSCALALKEDAKSKRNIEVVAYMYAICAETGIPLTYDVCHGNCVDSQTFHRITGLLKGHGIEIQGVIIDRGFATEAVLDHIRSLHFPFVVMLKSDNYGYTQMLDKYWETIKCRVDHLVNDDGIFGISEQHRIFRTSSENDYVSLFYDMNNGTARAFTLISKVLTAKKKMEGEINAGIRPQVPAEMKKYLDVTVNPDQTFQVVCNYDVWQQDVDLKGFTAMGSSENFGAKETDRIYNLRNSSEVQYSFIKNQMGSDVSRVHTTDSILNKFTVCFVSSIIRNEIQLNCKELGYNTNSVIREVDRIELLLQPNRSYIAIHDETNRARLLLNRFDIIPSDFDTIAAEVTARFSSSAQSLERKKPEHAPTGIKRGRKPAQARAGQDGSGTDAQPGSSPAGAESHKVDDGLSSGGGSGSDNPDVAPSGYAGQQILGSGRPSGRPKGSKNKSTLERERLLAEGKLTLPEKGKPGRPKGSKNKPKAPEAEELIKRRPGRPKGSKNKPKVLPV